MTLIGPKGNPVEYRGGSRDEVLLEIGYSDFANLFQVSKKTIYRWIKAGKFDPQDLLDIARFYNERLLAGKISK